MAPLKIFLCGVSLIFAAKSWSQNIYIHPEQNLKFGYFTASENGGTVTVSFSGERSSSGTVHLLNSDFHPAIFSISTDHTTPLTILVEISQETLTNGEGTAMILASVSSPSDVYTIQAGKPVQIKIGGTLQLDSAVNFSGNFRGNISITAIPYSEKTF